MFRLAHRTTFVRALLASLITIATLAIGAFFILKIIKVDAATNDGDTVVVTSTGDNYYDDDNYTGHYHVTVNGETIEAFCAQPSLNSPIGTTTATKMSNNTNSDKLIKFVIYLYQNNNTYTSSIRNSVFSAWNTNEWYAWAHAIIGVLYYNDHTNLSTEAITNINNAITTLQSYINNNSDAWAIARNYQLYFAAGYAPGHQDVVWIEEDPQYGSVSVQKCDSASNFCSPQGDASFAGINFEIYVSSGGRIYNPRMNRFYNNGDLVATGTTTETGVINFINLIADGVTYLVKETATNTSYELTAAQQTVTLTSSNNNQMLNFYNAPVKGSITVNKVDAETNVCVPYGNLSFFDATFELVNNSANAVFYNGASIAKGAVVDVKALAAGSCSVVFNDLPFGTYIIRETSASTGYVANSTPRTVTIPAAGTSNVHVTTTIENQVIRGDVKFVKMDETNNTPIQNAIFSISSLDSNDEVIETHIVVSNQNGVVDTSSNFALHSNHTNGYDALYEQSQAIRFAGYGTWFGLDHDSQSLPVQDSLGALPYGKYVIQELECDANLFCYDIADQKATITISSNNQVVNLGDWNNTCAEFSLETEATDATDGDKFLEISTEKVTIKDEVAYCVKPGLEFTIKGVLMDKTTGEELLIDDKPVESAVSFTSEEACGKTEMTFDFDASALGGKEIVVFESLYYQDNLIIAHEDINDDAQTVEVIKLYTYATNAATNDKILPVDEDTKIKDVVEYCLKPGVEYTVVGVLMDQQTGKEFLVDGKPVRQEVEFTPQKACGSFEMFYSINTTGLGGTKLVIFESLYRENELILAHKDLNNVAESVEVVAPSPDTGFITKNSENQNSSASSAAPSITLILVISLGGYMARRFSSRKTFLSRNYHK